MNRRQALAALSGLAVAGLTAGCGRPSLRIAVVWSGWELSRFHEVMRGSELAKEFDIIVYSAGDDIPVLLRNLGTATVTPDVAIVSQPGLLWDPEIRSRLQSFPSPDPPYWRDLAHSDPANPIKAGTGAPPADDSVKGVWFKVAHKSLVWYDKTDNGAEILPTPSTDWTTWLNRFKEFQPDRSPLSIGAADGWMLTDWFENILLGVDGTTYRRLYQDPAAWGSGPVEQTLEQLAELWSVLGSIPGWGSRALTMQFHDSILEVFHYRRAVMLAAPDFAWPLIRRYSPSAQPAASLFPWQNSGRPPPILVGGDFAVALTSSGARGRRFVEWLSSRDAGRQMNSWARQGGFLSLRPTVDDYPEPIKNLVVPQLDDPIAFDLSDRLTGGLAGGNGKGLWRVLTRMFIKVAVDGDRSRTPVGEAMRSLRRLSERRA